MKMKTSDFSEVFLVFYNYTSYNQVVTERNKIIRKVFCNEYSGLL